MPKKPEREVTIIGMPPTSPLEALAKIREGELAAANAKAARDDEMLASGLYRGHGADPGAIVGLDEITPQVETAEDGDSTRTDPDTSRPRAAERPARR